MQLEVSGIDICGRDSTRDRSGFTLLELLIVCVVLIVVVAVSAPAISTALVRTKVSQAASLVAGDLSRAFTLAGRARYPVRVSFEIDSLRYRVVNLATGELILDRRFGEESEYRLTAMAVSQDLIDILPNGFVSVPGETEPMEPLVVRLAASRASRQITLTRTGQVKVSE